MLPPGFHGNPAPVPVFAGDDENAVQLGLIDELHAIRNREESHPARWLTSRMGIIEPASGSAVLVQSSGPILERHLLERQIARQAASDWTTAHVVPESLDAWNLTQVHASVRPTRGRLGRPGCRSASRASTSARTSPGLITGSRFA